MHLLLPLLRPRLEIRCRMRITTLFGSMICTINCAKNLKLSKVELAIHQELEAAIKLISRNSLALETIIKTTRPPPTSPTITRSPPTSQAATWIQITSTLEMDSSLMEITNRAVTIRRNITTTRTAGILIKGKEIKPIAIMTTSQTEEDTKIGSKW